MQSLVYRKLAQRQRKIARRIRHDHQPSDHPVFTAGNLAYEFSARVHGLAWGGIGAVHLLARRSRSTCRSTRRLSTGRLSTGGLIDAINRRLHLLQVHLPYHESDHVLAIPYNLLADGTCLQDLDTLRTHEAFLNALGARRIPDPTMAGDFCRRFTEADVGTLQDIFNTVRVKLWRQQPRASFRQAIVDAACREPPRREPPGRTTGRTNGTLFARLSPAGFERCLVAWTEALRQSSQGQFIALDGKTLRRSAEHAWDKTPIHMVSAYAAANHLILGQLKVDGKANEIVAIPKLLEWLNLKRTTVTIDAMGCQKEIARQIVKAQGHYVLALKENQPSLHDAVQALLDEAIREQFQDLRHDVFEETDGDHGRIETRRVWGTNEVRWLKMAPEWPGLRQMVVVESRREINPQVSTERRYYIASHRTLDARRTAAAIRLRRLALNSTMLTRKHDGGVGGAAFAERARQRLTALDKDPTILADIKQAGIDSRADTAEAIGLAAEKGKDYARAIKVYESYVTSFPTSHRIKEVTTHLAELKADKTIVAAVEKANAERDGKSNVGMAEGYIRVGKPELAKPLLEEIITKYPDSEWAAKAKELLETIK